ncbi:MAG: tetratricopeptide (TPR) repeat protein [Candidatus Endobugula sp.]|jgi:tetratricopeptide (TPR) repeat protein
MWLQTDNNNILYQISYLQYALKRYNESKNNVAILITKVKEDDEIVITKQDGTTQEVKFAAALKNLEGLVALEEGNSEAAKAFFTAALTLNPDFEGAKLSLAAIK